MTTNSLREEELLRKPCGHFPCKGSCKGSECIDETGFTIICDGKPKDLSTIGEWKAHPKDELIQDPQNWRDRLWNIGYKFTHEKFTLGDLNRYAKAERKIHEAELSKARQQGREEVVEEVHVMAIVYEGNEEAPLYEKLYKHLVRKFTPKN